MYFRIPEPNHCPNCFVRIPKGLAVLGDGLNNPPTMELQTSDTQPQLSFEVEPADEKPKGDWRQEVPSVSQLTRRVRGHIENAFFDVWVKGEISNLRKPVSGHAYFLMKDASAQLKAVMFRGALQKTKFQLQDGMEVLLHGTLTVYEARGEYQIVADAVEPVGQGALQLAFEQLKKKLHAEGLFDPKHKKKLPYLPKRVAMVTSATGAAVKDVLKVLGRRFPNLKFFVIPASVQGEKAAPEIVSGIRLAEKWNAENPDDKIDVMIVGRGGGSMEDLWPFNEEIVARAIHACPIPIISAVGHEIDFTIADFVADLRAPTPSAAAEIVVPRLDELQNQLATQKIRLSSNMKKSMQQLRLHLGHLSSRLVDPRERIRIMKEQFTMLAGKLTTAMKTQLKFARRRWESSTQMLHSLSPLQVIGRGYAITKSEDGKILRSVTALQKGDKVTTQLHDGTFQSEILSISKNLS